MSESFWVERAQTAEAQLKTLREAQGAAIERIKAFKQNFGVKERGNGEIVIDYPKFVERLGEEAAAELRKVIDEKYQLPGPPRYGRKRKVKPAEAVHA